MINPVKLSIYPMHKTQQGAILIISIILLFIMSLIAINTVTVVKMDERITANLRDSIIAYEEAESVILQVEDTIDMMADVPLLCFTPGTCSICIESDGTCTPRVLSPKYTQDLYDTENHFIRTDSFWVNTGVTHASLSHKLNTGSTGSADAGIAEVDGETLFIVEEHATKKKINHNGTYMESLNDVYYFRITARGQGQDSANKLVQTVYARKFD